MAQQDRVRPLWLPAYAPELNLIERVWRHLKDKGAAIALAAAALLSRTEARFHQPSGCLGRVCKPRGERLV